MHDVFASGRELVVAGVAAAIFAADLKWRGSDTDGWVISVAAPLCPAVSVLWPTPASVGLAVLAVLFIVAHARGIGLRQTPFGLCILAGIALTSTSIAVGLVSASTVRVLCALGGVWLSQLLFLRALSGLPVAETNAVAIALSRACVCALSVLLMAEIGVGALAIGVAGLLLVRVPSRIIASVQDSCMETLRGVYAAIGDGDAGGHSEGEMRLGQELADRGLHPATRAAARAYWLALNIQRRMAGPKGSVEPDSLSLDPELYKLACMASSRDVLERMHVSRGCGESYQDTEVGGRFGAEDAIGVVENYL